MNKIVTTEIKDITANPAPLGLLGFGMTTVLLNLHNAGFFALGTMIMAMGICSISTTKLINKTRRKAEFCSQPRIVSLLFSIWDPQFDRQGNYSMLECSRYDKK